MASAADVRDIMGMAPLDNTVTKDSILGNDKKRFKVSRYIINKTGIYEFYSRSTVHKYGDKIEKAKGLI